MNRVSLTDGEISRLLDEIVTPDVFTAARMPACPHASYLKLQKKLD